MKTLIVILLTSLSAPLFAAVSFTPAQWACDRQAFGDCPDLSQKAAYTEAIRYLKEKKGLIIDEKNYALWCGKDKNGDREGSSYHFQFNNKLKECFINIWVDCTTGEVPEKSVNSVDVRCK